MRAIVVREFGGKPEAADMPTPEAGPGQLQIQLEAAGVNPFDRLIIDGYLDGKLPHDFPLIPGTDGAGTITAVGAGVNDFEIGDRVVGKFLIPPVRHGTFAEYIVVPRESTIAKLPDEVTAIRAAALPTAGITALDLMHAAGVKGGQRVLIVGASGGVGSYLVQLGALAGAHVIATARPDDTDRMIRLGATEVVNYGRVTVTDSPTRAEDSELSAADSVRMTHPGGIDVLFDLVSAPPVFADNASLVKPGGWAYSTTGSADEADLKARGISGGNLQSSGGAAELRELLRLVGNADLMVPISNMPPLAAAAEVIGASGARGKTVLVI
ncbi:NADP-dependent oxidoreductase [Nocardia seriolae]|uniref:NADP-dependent oxidoreductase n=1 Tax=Nocardia seriolae TaxID=37332 RepID=UPI0008FF051F|nr:NADP-dependent oxidoreductase [Nocardia seriolae]OJF83847.1 alcohol dehydrogenase [Nocardia seriolae]PSK32257.1 NADP-dependent oxidoreductase [Nocardia seriolae]QOW31928.1 NADP-dependent oxidoreductase [Nocardia seriolae]QUN19535.1 NADP-dependent oxidoreductase [Nocardia seriolae]WNJ58996.1 NADP-dependent oxidoreductase [Nocardia seriolae]